MAWIEWRQVTETMYSADLVPAEGYTALYILNLLETGEAYISRKNGRDRVCLTETRKYIGVLNDLWGETLDDTTSDFSTEGRTEAGALAAELRVVMAETEGGEDEGE